MLDSKKLSQLSKLQQLDLIKCKVEVARLAYARAKDESQEVRDILFNYKQEVEEVLEKAAWALT